MYDWKFWLAVLIVSSFIFLCAWLDGRKEERKRLEQHEYESWLAEHGFKPKGKT